jgi:superfamily II RNA helicase
MGRGGYNVLYGNIAEQSEYGQIEQLLKKYSTENQLLNCHRKQLAKIVEDNNMPVLPTFFFRFILDSAEQENNSSTSNINQEQLAQLIIELIDKKDLQQTLFYKINYYNDYLLIKLQPVIDNLLSNMDSSLAKDIFKPGKQKIINCSVNEFPLNNDIKQMKYAIYQLLDNSNDYIIKHYSSSSLLKDIAKLQKKYFKETGLKALQYAFIAEHDLNNEKQPQQLEEMRNRIVLNKKMIQFYSTIKAIYCVNNYDFSLIEKRFELFAVDSQKQLKELSELDIQEIYY